MKGGAKMIRVKDQRRRFRCAVRAVYRAFARERARKERDLVGRWALPSGVTFTVVRIDPQTGLALIANGLGRWQMPARELEIIRAEGMLRCLGRTT